MPKTVAVIGASNNRGKFGNRAVRAYRQQGYTVIPINTHEREVEGLVAFRSVLDVDDATWIRARGAALHQALLIIPYYPKTNAALVTMATRTVAEVLADHDA